MKRTFCLWIGFWFAWEAFAVGDVVVSTNVGQLAPGFAIGVEPHRIVQRGESQRVWEQVKYLTNFNLPVPPALFVGYTCTIRAAKSVCW